jgi:putative transposase
MATRSHEDWVTLLQEQPASGLTITAFCRRHKVSISSFYAHKADMTNTSIPKVAPFVKATLASSAAMTTQAQPSALGQTIRLAMFHNTVVYHKRITVFSVYLALRCFP